MSDKSEALRQAAATAADLERRLAAHSYALVRISLALGGSDEWTDEETMLADVIRQAEERERQLEKAQRELERLTKDRDDQWRDKLRERESSAAFIARIKDLESQVAALELMGDQAELQSLLDIWNLDFERMRERALNAERQLEETQRLLIGKARKRGLQLGQSR